MASTLTTRATCVSGRRGRVQRVCSSSRCAAHTVLPAPGCTAGCCGRGGRTRALTPLSVLPPRPAATAPSRVGGGTLLLPTPPLAPSYPPRACARAAQAPHAMSGLASASAAPSGAQTAACCRTRHRQATPQPLGGGGLAARAAKPILWRCGSSAHPPLRQRSPWARPGGVQAAAAAEKLDTYHGGKVVKVRRGGGGERRRASVGPLVDLCSSSTRSSRSAAEGSCSARVYVLRQAGVAASLHAPPRPTPVRSAVPLHSAGAPRAHPQLFHHRPHRPRQVHARRPAADQDGHGGESRHAGAQRGRGRARAARGWVAATAGATGARASPTLYLRAARSLLFVLRRPSTWMAWTLSASAASPSSSTPHACGTTQRTARRTRSTSSTPPATSTLATRRAGRLCVCVCVWGGVEWMEGLSC